MDGMDFVGDMDTEKTHLRGYVHSVHSVHSVQLAQIAESRFTAIVGAPSDTVNRYSGHHKSVPASSRRLAEACEPLILMQMASSQLNANSINTGR